LPPTSSAEGSRSIAILALCFGAATFEGVDIQSMGFAGPQLMPAFGLDPAQFGLAASSSLAGLVIGGAIGGRLADYVGHARVLLFSMIMLGLFSLATPFCSIFPFLVLVRFFVGLGLGGAIPTLIAISASATPGRQGVATALMYCGFPLGGALLGWLTLLALGLENWRLVFYIGGAGPLSAGFPECRLDRSDGSRRRSDRCALFSSFVRSAPMPLTITITRVRSFKSSQ
jgi:MFS transporter, AAHS family, 3-hydroxyphenylpropionic acid transporter